MAFPTMLTDLELSGIFFPTLPFRSSQRRSSSITKPIACRSYEDLRPWPRFMEDAAALAGRLDNQQRRNINPIVAIFPLDEAADEIGVRVPLEAHIFPRVNYLAGRLGLIFRYKEGGSGRSFSFTDLVILDSSQAQPLGDRKELSRRVFGNGEAKGNWQCTLEGFDTLVEALRDSRKGNRVNSVIQQVFGDMVLDETKYGFITEYNYTVFLRRVAGTKVLEYSPIINLRSAPIEKFLFVLSCAEVDKLEKPNFSRLTVEDTPSEGYKVEKVYNEVCEVYDEDDLAKIPTYAMRHLGITGLVIGMGKYGNVIEGRHPDGTKLALKLFDLRNERAVSAFVREQKAYCQLKLLQGSHIPRLLAVGRIPHTNIVFLALTDEGNCDVLQLLHGKQGRRVERNILQCLSDIHACGILHNDIKLSHVLWRHQAPKFIDFDASMYAPGSRDALMTELTMLEEVLAEARNHELPL